MTALTAAVHAKLAPVLVSMSLVVNDPRLAQLPDGIQAAFKHSVNRIEAIVDEVNQAIEETDMSKLSITRASEVGPLIADFKKNEAIVKSVFASMSRLAT